MAPRVTIAPPGRREGPRPPRPHGEAARARRTAIVAFAFFLAAAVFLAWQGIDLASLRRAFPLYALGGFGVLIFGTMRLLIAGMAGREMVGGAASSGFTVGAAAIGAIGVFALARFESELAFWPSLLWSAAAISHAVVTVWTMRRPPSRRVILDEAAPWATRAPLDALALGGVVYALISATLVPASYLGHVRSAAAIHVVLVGFVIVTIMAVALHILPRFTAVAIPRTATWLLAPPALVGPMWVAMGLDHHANWLLTGAWVEGAAFVVFGATVAWSLVRSRRLRWHHLGYAGAPLAIGIGGVIALAFVSDGRWAAQLALHGLLNVFGFVGLFVFAASTDLFAPALRPGAAPAKQHARLAAAAALTGLIVAAIGAGRGDASLARAGMGAYALAVAWQLAGIVSAHRRAGRVLTRLRAT